MLDLDSFSFIFIHLHSFPDFVNATPMQRTFDQKMSKELGNQGNAPMAHNFLKSLFP